MEKSMLLSAFEYECCNLAPEMRAGIEIASYPCITPYWEYDVDWWSNYDISEFLASNKTGLLISNTRKGTIQTAQYLYEQKDSPREQFVIWISAWLHDYFSGTFKFHRSIRPLTREILKELRDRSKYYSWHHASRNALPESVSSNYLANTLFYIDSMEHLIYLMAIDTALAFRGGRVVETSNFAKLS